VSCADHANNPVDCEAEQGKLSNMGAFGAFRAIRDGSRDEYRGWRKFRHSTGIWPVWSMLSVISIPLLLFVGVNLEIRALETGRLTLIYTALVALVLALGLLWFGLRRLANHADLSRARKITGRAPSRAERFIG
jgi:hypothetical protein